MLDLTKKPAHPLVAASVLSADFGRMADECRDMLRRGADLLHLDVMDGHFVSNLTMGQDMIRGVRRHLPEAFLDVHLMVQRPGDYVDSFADAGANHFTFHLEVCREMNGDVDADALIERITKRGMTAGMVINPATPPEGLEKYLDRLTMALVMSVVPGKSGQAFMAQVLPKVRWIAERIDGATRLEMDGGISPQTASAASAAGCDVMVTASALFGAADRTAVIDALHAAAGDD
jgi:ribulose-phosphate 3-epimerase